MNDEHQTFDPPEPTERVEQGNDKDDGEYRAPTRSKNSITERQT